MAVDGTFVGPSVNIGYGTVQVKIVVANGRITDALAIQAPSGRNDRYTNMSVPVLKQQTLAAQSAKIQGVSGASYTSMGWIESLQGALVLANLPEAKLSSPASSAAPSQPTRNETDSERYSFKPAQWDGLPSNLFTPGARDASVNQSNIKATICTANYIKSKIPTSTSLNSLKVKQVKAGYIVDGITDAKLYAEDFLIPIELGGSPTSEENLWPELIEGTNGYLAKNKLEKVLHNSLCSGQITLQQAQDAVSIDWVEEYDSRFGTQSGTRYANSSKSGSNGLVSMNFQGGKNIDCVMNKVHSIDMNMYGITDWTLFITYPNGIKSEISRWNSTDNVLWTSTESGAGAGTYQCTASINGEKGVIAKLVGSLTIDATGSPVRANKIMQTLIGPRIDANVTGSSVPSKPVKYKNCAGLNAVYPGGVALPGAVNKGGSTSFKPTFDRQIYSANTSLDRDKDGIACEK